MHSLGSLLLSPCVKKAKERDGIEGEAASSSGKVKSVDCTVARVFTLFTAPTCRVNQPRPMSLLIMERVNLPTSPAEAKWLGKARVSQRGPQGNACARLARTLSRTIYMSSFDG